MTITAYLEQRLRVLKQQRKNHNTITNDTHRLDGAIVEAEHALAAARAWDL